MRIRLLALFAAACVLVLALAAGAGAYPYAAAAPVTASGPSPFAGCTFGANGEGVLTPNAELEPFVAVNPLNPLNVVGVFQQDRWSDGGAHGLVASTSTDGGTTWTESYAAFSKCADASSPYDRASDPWVTFDPAGFAYQISLSVSADFLTSAILVSKSTTGGTSSGLAWSAPKTLIRDDSVLVFNDKESITADPTRPGYVYAIWDRGDFPSDRRGPSSWAARSYRGYPTLSRTTDGGATWSTPRTLSNANIFTIGNQIAVLPNGGLVDVTKVYQGSGAQPNANAAYEGAFISSDAGVSWTGPIKIANDIDVPVTDPDTGAPVRAGTDIPDVAVDPLTGALYVVWADGSLSGGAHGDVLLSRSTDGGRKWSDPIKVNQTPNGAQAFNPTVAVAADGTVQVGYYDFRNNTGATGLPTDVWLAHSHDGGITWGAETHLAGPFDMETAAFARGYFLGDYQGLASIGNDALAFFGATTGVAGNASDILSVRAHP